MSVTHATVTASSLNVRQAGDPNSALLGTLGRHATVEVLGRAGNWYEVSAGPLRGFVHGDFLHLDTAPDPIGFLCHDDGLCTTSMTPPAEQTIDTSALTGTTKQAAQTWNRYGALLGSLSAATSLAPSAAVGVLCVESSGQGFVNGRLVIRFEPHVFWDRWGKTNAGAFDRCFSFDSGKRWTGHRYRATERDAWSVAHRGQDAEWEAFSIARALDEASAMRSISMGAPQIMGFNHAAIGYDSARAMFDRFSADDRFHILALFDFIKGAGRTSRMLEALRRQEYEQFATHYNGNGQAAVYGARIRSVVSAFEKVAPRAATAVAPGGA
jgi:hypothetical protein